MVKILKDLSSVECMRSQVNVLHHHQFEQNKLENEKKKTQVEDIFGLKYQV